MIRVTGREALLQAAAEAVIDLGLERVTTREICDRAGVKAPALYHHFGTKDGLLDHLLEHTFARYQAAKDATPLTGDPATDLRSGWDAHLEFARTNAAIYPLMLRPGSAHSESSLATLRMGFQQLHADGALRDGITPDLATTVLSSALRGIASRICRSPDDPELERASEVLRDAVVRDLLEATHAATTTIDPRERTR